MSNSEALVKAIMAAAIDRWSYATGYKLECEWGPFGVGWWTLRTDWSEADCGTWTLRARTLEEILERIGGRKGTTLMVAE